MCRHPPRRRQNSCSPGGTQLRPQGHRAICTLQGMSPEHNARQRNLSEGADQEDLTCSLRPSPPPSDPGVLPSLLPQTSTPSQGLFSEPHSHLRVDQHISVPDHTPGGHTHGHHLAAPSAGHLVVPHGHTHMPAYACVQSPCDNPGPCVRQRGNQ